MKNSEFKYWLQGYFALERGHNRLSPRQLVIIENHLNLVLAIDGKLSVELEIIKGLLDTLKNSQHRSDELLSKAYDEIYHAIIV